MRMANGIKQWVDGAIDTVEETAKELIDGGMEPKAAVQAAAILTKNTVADRLDKNLGNKNASLITHSLGSQTTPVKH